MADAQDPRRIIVRADFGGGVDQSMDAWRAPPSQLSQLTNGRLERAGSIRKRTGYQPTQAPLGSAGEPLSALSGPAQTVVIDKARDSYLDNWTHLNTTPVRIANECGYVARNYSPTTGSANNAWTTTGPASDVIGDVVVLDGNAGDVDECVDFAAHDGWIFVVKVTRASAAASVTTLTLSQYDATTQTLVSEHSQTFAGGAPSPNAARMYPKILIYPSIATIVIAAAFNATVTTAVVQFYVYGFAASGVTLAATPAPTARQATVDYFDVTAFATVPEARYRPACPWDVAATVGNGLFFAQYRTGVGLRTERFDVTPGAITSTAFADHTPVGVNDLQALSIASVSGGIALVGVAIPFNAALTPPYQPGNYQCPLVTLNATTCALIAHNVNPVLVAAAGATAIPGRLTVAEYQAQGSSELRVCGFVEVLEYTAGFVYASRLVRVGMGFGNVTATDVTVSKSAATPAGRMFHLSYGAAVGTTSRLPVRLPLVVGSSQQTFDGRVPLTNVPYTDFAGNYSSVIGTQILVGVDEMTLTCANSPVQTVSPRLQPCPPPRAFAISNVWYVPHLVALDGAAGFGIAAIRLAQRQVGDTSSSSFATLPIAPGGVVQQSDGERFAEVALVDRPRIGAVLGSNLGTANDFTAGDYIVQAIASYRDSNGNVHRSTPSDPYRFVSAPSPSTARSWQIWFSYQSFTNRNDVQIEFYVTAPNGTIPRYWFSVQNVVGGSFNATTRTDSAIGGQGLPALDAPTLYTTKALPFVPIPSARWSLTFKNRLLVGGADDARSIWYSNAPIAYQAASFAVGNVIRLEHENGCTAAGNVNDKLILFSELGIYATYGQFRDPDGTGNALAELESIHNYIGCTQPVSVVTIPTGVLFFGSDDRFYLINERLELVPVGLRVQDVTTTAGQNFSVCQAAVHIEPEREIRFYMRNPVAQTCIVCVYNYQVDQWGTDAIAINGTTTFASWHGATASPQLGCLLPHASQWITDNATTHTDFNTYIPLVVATAWIQPGGSQDYARFRYAQILGRFVDAHDLTVQVRVDFDDNTIAATGTWTAAQLAPVTSTAYPEQVRLQVGTQKTQCVKITISDAAPSSGGYGIGRGPQLIGLALEMMPLGGMRRLPDARKR
jgi:hypothetical protein